VTSSDDNSPRSLGNELLATLRTVAEVLQRRSIRYALIGDLAVVARGRVRTTRDIDLLISVSQFTLPRLLDDLVEMEVLSFSCSIR